MSHAETLIAYLADPTTRVLRSYERLRTIYPDARQARLSARAMALRTTEKALPWWQVADLIAAEQSLSR